MGCVMALWRYMRYGAAGRPRYALWAGGSNLGCPRYALCVMGPEGGAGEVPLKPLDFNYFTL